MILCVVVKWDTVYANVGQCPTLYDDRPAFPFHCPTLKYASEYMNAIFAVTHHPQIYITESIYVYNKL